MITKGISRFGLIFVYLICIQPLCRYFQIPKCKAKNLFLIKRNDTIKINTTNASNHTFCIFSFDWHDFLPVKHVNILEILSINTFNRYIVSCEFFNWALLTLFLHKYRTLHYRFGELLPSFSKVNFAIFSYKKKVVHKQFCHKIQFIHRFSFILIIQRTKIYKGGSVRL